MPRFLRLHALAAVRRRSRQPGLVLLAGALASVVAPGTARPAILSWANAAGGSAATAGNWSPVQVPTAADELQFNLAGTYPITFDGSVPTSLRHVYRKGSIALGCAPFHSVTGGFTVGSASGDAPFVTLTGTLTHAPTALIAAAVGSTGRLKVTGFNSLFQVTTSTSDIVVGNGGAGTLELDPGAIVRAADDIMLGNQEFADGVVQVNGVSGGLPATLRTEGTGGDFLIGNQGAGVLTVTGGGVARSADDVFLAWLATSTANVTVGNGVGVSVLEAVDELYVGANDLTSAAGAATLTVAGGGAVVCGDTLRIGDAGAGALATLRVDGGSVQTRHLLVDSLRGNLELHGGSVTVRGGRFRAGASLEFEARESVGDATFALVQGTTGSIAHGVIIYGGNSRTANFRVDNGSTLDIGGIFGAYGENVEVEVDSSAILTVEDRFYLGGASNDTDLSIRAGGRVEVGSMEMTDGGGATSILTIRGAGSTLGVWNTLLIGGDEVYVGGPSTVVVSAGGSIRPLVVGMSIRVRPPGFLDIDDGGAVGTGGGLTVEGRCRLQGGGSLVTQQLVLVGDGRLEARGSILARTTGTSANSTIFASGNLDIGEAASATGFDFRGTLDVGPHTVRLFDSGAIVLGDSTRIAGGTLDPPTTLTVPTTGVLRGHGTLASTGLTNQGTVEAGGATTFGTLVSTGTYTQASTGTIAFKVRGSAAGEHDRLTASGAITCAGTLRVVFDPTGGLAPGSSIVLLSGSTRSGTFSSFVVDGLVQPAGLTLLYTPTEVRLLAVSGVVGVPGEFDPPARLEFRGLGGPGTAAFELALPAASLVSLELFDVTGRSVGGRATEDLVAGRHRFPVHALLAGRTRRAPGVYFARARVRSSGGAEQLLHDRIIVLD